MALIVQHPSIAAAQGLSTQGQHKKQALPIADSSYLMNVDYDPANLQMTVTMKNGAQYLYFYVYPNIMQGFIESPSKGAYYSKVVKGQHKSTRLIDKGVGKATKKTSKK